VPRLPVAHSRRRGAKEALHCTARGGPEPTRLPVTPRPPTRHARPQRARAAIQQCLSPLGPSPHSDVRNRKTRRSSSDVQWSHSPQVLLLHRFDSPPRTRSRTTSSGAACHTAKRNGRFPWLSFSYKRPHEQLDHRRWRLVHRRLVQLSLAVVVFRLHGVLALLNEELDALRWRPLLESEMERRQTVIGRLQ
jgi:hypothetical protein